MMDDMFKKDFNKKLRDIQESYDRAIDNMNRVNKENQYLKSEHYKDEELKRMKENLDDARKYTIFPAELIDKARAHLKAENDGYVGQLCGSFKITLTHIATNYEWTCPICKQTIDTWW